jgi:hypothetical protein
MPGEENADGPGLVIRVPVIHTAPWRLGGAWMTPGETRGVATAMVMPARRETRSGRIRSHNADPHAHDRRGRR